MLVERVRKRPPLPDSARIAAHRVEACVSAAWVAGEFRDGRCHFLGEADSPLVRGLVCFLADAYSGFSPEEILAGESTVIADLGLERQLSPTRMNGLRGVVAHIRRFAETVARG